MKTSLMTLTIPLGVLALMGPSRTASADDAPVARPYTATEQSETMGPNRALLHTGIWTFVLSYVPAVVVAVESSRNGDKNLYVPIAGPWMDLAARSDCAPNASCNNETVNKVLIVVDGVFQGIAALNFVGAFLFYDRRTVTVSSVESREIPPSLSLRVSPAQVGRGAYGLMALGTF